LFFYSVPFVFTPVMYYSIPRKLSGFDFYLGKLMSVNIAGIDILVLAGYFIILFGIGIAVSRRKGNSTDYFLAGRNVGWFAIGASLFASNISSEHFIGLAGSGAASGLAVGHFEWLACLIVLLLGWLFAPFYLRSSVFTMPEFLERRYNSASRWYLTSISIVAYVMTKISVTLFAGGLLLKQIVGWDMVTSAIIMVVATGIYTVIGGLRAVIYTELIQMFILIGGAVTLTVVGLNEVGGVSGLQSNTPPEFWHMFKPLSDPDFPWTGIIFGAPILGIWYWCTDQYIVQRVLSARGIDDARGGTIFAGYLKILPVFIMVIPGLIAFILFPEIIAKDSNLAYPTLVTKLLPAGVRGVVIASLLAALMSSLASCFNSSSTLFTMDVYKKLKPEAEEKELVRMGRLATVVLVVLGIMWVPFIKGLSNQLFIYLQSVQAYVSPPIAAVFLFGVFSTRMNGKGALAALFTGFGFGALRLILELINKSNPLTFAPAEWLAEINFLHFAILLFGICTAVLILVSLFTEKPKQEKLDGLTFRYRLAAGEALSISPFWNKINIGMSILLGLIVFALWAIFF